MFFSVLFSSFLVAIQTNLVHANNASANIQVQISRISQCDFAISTASGNETSFNVLYDTTKSTGTVPDSLASTDKENSTESTCVVCASLKWSNNKFGVVQSVDYDFYHRLDPGTLEQVVTYMTMDNSTKEEYFESSYIYGSEETNSTFRTHSTQANGSDPLLLDYSRPKEELCIQTTFRVFSRGGWDGGAAEISRKSVFVQSVNLAWVDKKT
ncbi:hypothetical protein BDV96DRAFT_599686 [Lophiotrema nucula]|uniref:Uncharacterized protein n=1 Tax=Lophiotrema nucula TaxID=690887 RepID=A0A6A5ZA72_9PLEO|nr:hypothetical protein BDV96DRAFT_599686 [Lophiotrema nucula]